jgi:hypothetical protein
VPVSFEGLSFTDWIILGEFVDDSTISDETSSLWVSVGRLSGDGFLSSWSNDETECVLLSTSIGESDVSGVISLA